MDFLNTVVTQNTHIHNAVKLVKQFPVTQKLTDMYRKSSKNELLFIGAATYITLYNLSSYINGKRQKLNLPPMVPYALPLFGHSLYLMTFPSKFIDWCNLKYGEVYNLNLRGTVITIANGKSGEESLKSDSLDLSLEQAVVRDVLHLDYSFKEHIMQKTVDINSGSAKLVIPNPKMPLYVPGIRSGINNACEDLLKEDVTHFENPSKFFQKFVAYMTVPAFTGEEFALNMDLIDSFAFFTGDIIKNVGKFMIIPKSLHSLVLPYMQSAKKHQDRLKKYIVPVVLRNREKMRLAELAGEEHGIERNYLQTVIEHSEFDENGVEVFFTPEEISQFVLLFAFASVHTTSMHLSFAVYWLLARPDLKEKLMEEIERYVPGNSPVTAEALAEMKFLSNFIRESIRQGIDRLSKGRKAMRDYTFSNGYQVPKGRIVAATLRQMNFGDNFTRATIEEMDPDMSKNKNITTPGRDFVSFGAGKHLCPGRFFAIQEIQMTLIHLLKNYDIKTASGKIPNPVPTIVGYMTKNCEDPLVFTRKN